MPILFVALLGLVMLVIERVRPGFQVPLTRSYLLRALLLNLIQLGLVRVFALSVDPFLAERSLFRLPLSGAWAALVGYFVLTFVFYFWHRARHEVPWLFRYVHQLHHSPARIDVLQAFYKHPLEILCNTLISGVVLFVLLGLSIEEASWAVALSGVGELIYHWNVRTPYGMGFVFQRPEMHREHHREGVHTHNFSDLPLWDFLFGTLLNPRTFEGRCGFGDAEHDFVGLLLGRRVGAVSHVAAMRRERTGRGWVRRRRTIVLTTFVVLASAQMFGRIFDWEALTGLAAASAASPAPKVFTAHEGLETFSSRVWLELRRPSGSETTDLTSEHGMTLSGPYNRRNVYGALVAYAPLLHHNEKTRPMFEAALKRALCGPEPLLRELVHPRSADPLIAVAIEHVPRPGTRTSLPLRVEVSCD